MTALASANLVVNIMLSFSLKYVWNFVNLLQFLVFMTQWGLNFPLNALAVLKYLKSIALMEFIPTHQITTKISGWLGLDSTDPNNIVSNMGIMLVIAIGLLMVIVALGLASCFVNKNYKFYKKYQDIKGVLYYNVFIRYLLQSCLKLGIAAGTTLTTTKYSGVTPTKIGTICTSTLILGVILISPLLFGLILKLNFVNLKLPSLKSKFGTLYLSIKDNNKWALTYSSIFMFRRIIFLGLTFGLSTFASLQIHLFTFVTLAYTAYLGLAAPHDISVLTN